MTDTAHVATPSELQQFWVDGIDITLPVGRVRTITACTALHCRCVEYADGIRIGAYQCCVICTHTQISHQPRTTGQKVRR